MILRFNDKLFILFKLVDSHVDTKSILKIDKSTANKATSPMFRGKSPVFRYQKLVQANQQ